jgi:hypothetical protein
MELRLKRMNLLEKKSKSIIWIPLNANRNYTHLVVLISLVHLTTKIADNPSLQQFEHNMTMNAIITSWKSLIKYQTISFFMNNNAKLRLSTNFINSCRLTYKKFPQVFLAKPLYKICVLSYSYISRCSRKTKSRCWLCCTCLQDAYPFHNWTTCAQIPKWSLPLPIA